PTRRSSDLADDAAGEHVHAAERVAVAQGVHGAVVGAEQRDLLAVHERADAALGQQRVVVADVHPGHVITTGLIWSRSFSNTMDGSGTPGALTKLTNRRSLSGSSSVARHSSA